MRLGLINHTANYIHYNTGYVIKLLIISNSSGISKLHMFIHMNTFYFNKVNNSQKFSGELEVPSQSVKLFHLERFALYGI